MTLLSRTQSTRSCLRHLIAEPPPGAWLHNPFGPAASSLRPLHTGRPSLSGANGKKKRAPIPIVIPPSFDGTVHKPTQLHLTLTPEERAQRYAALADRGIIDKLRSSGQFPRHLWLFAHDVPRLTQFDIEYGNGPVPDVGEEFQAAMDREDVPQPRLGSWLQRLFGNDSDKLAEYHARQRAENAKYISEEWFDETRELAEDRLGFPEVYEDFVEYVKSMAKPALEALSFSARHPHQWDSAANRARFSPTFHARIAAAMAFMRNVGKYEFRVEIDQVHEANVDQMFTITGEHAVLTSIDALHPRFFMRQVGPELHFHRRGDTVLDFFRENADHITNQYLVEMAVEVSGTVSVLRAPKAVTGGGALGTATATRGVARKGPNMKTMKHRGASGSVSYNQSRKPGGGSNSGTASYETLADDLASDRLVYREVLDRHTVFVRMVSPASRRLPRFDMGQVGAQPWKVWDVDHNVTEALLEHSQTAKDEEAPRYLRLGLNNERSE